MRYNCDASRLILVVIRIKAYSRVMIASDVSALRLMKHCEANVQGLMCTSSPGGGVDLLEHCEAPPYFV